MKKADEKIGEGNREADRRYRKDVRDTVNKTSTEERAEAARNLKDDELRESRAAAKSAKSRARR